LQSMFACFRGRLRLPLIEQRLRVLKGGVEALGEPVVDLGEHRAGFVAAIGVAQQPRGTLGCELTVFARVTYVMMVMTDGGERTQEEFADLFSRAGFKLTRVVPTPSLLSVSEIVTVGTRGRSRHELFGAFCPGLDRKRHQVQQPHQVEADRVPRAGEQPWRHCTRISLKACPPWFTHRGAVDGPASRQCNGCRRRSLLR